MLSFFFRRVVPFAARAATAESGALSGADVRELASWTRRAEAPSTVPWGPDGRILPYGGDTPLPEAPFDTSPEERRRLVQLCNGNRLELSERSLCDLELLVSVEAPRHRVGLDPGRPCRGRIGRVREKPGADVARYELRRAGTALRRREGGRGGGQGRGEGARHRAGPRPPRGDGSRGQT